MDVSGIKYNKLNIKLITSVVLLTLVSTPVVLSVFWQPWDPNFMNYEEILAAPSASHIFGTDNYGRDISHEEIELVTLSYVMGFIKGVFVVAKNTEGRIYEISSNPNSNRLYIDVYKKEGCKVVSLE